jgi:hypothetical protein
MFGFSLAFFWRENYDKIKASNTDSAETPAVGGEPSTVEVRDTTKWTANFLSVYYVAFGDFGETEDYKNNYDWVFFYLANFIICIIMMNLLIGILSEKLAFVMERKDQI